MAIRILMVVVFAATSALFHRGSAFQLNVNVNLREGTGSRRTSLCAHSPDGDGGRRGFLSHVGLTVGSFVPSLAARANDGQDLTSQLFNPDGSLKEGVTADEAKSRTLEFNWERSDKLLMAVDGANVADTANGSYVRLSYQVPEKWGTGSALYVDPSEGVNAKACNRVTVYKSEGTTAVDRLEKATLIGVGKALDVVDDMTKIRTADIIGGRKARKGEQKYYEFDMASAPETCGESKDNLGLGFCPFDSIFLISATVVEGSLYVIVVECDNEEWKQASADLKRVRSSFKVELL